MPGIIMPAAALTACPPRQSPARRLRIPSLQTLTSTSSLPSFHLVLAFTPFAAVSALCLPANMSAVGSLIFCTDCGNLLQESTGNENATLLCDVCGTRNKGI
jgi:hypothetical protein